MYWLHEFNPKEYDTLTEILTARSVVTSGFAFPTLSFTEESEDAPWHESLGEYMDDIEEKIPDPPEESLTSIPEEFRIRPGDIEINVDWSAVDELGESLEDMSDAIGRLNDRLSQISQEYLGRWYTEAPRLERHDPERSIISRYKKKQQAEEKAEELLLLCLNQTQKETYERDGFFDIIGSEGGRYRIHSYSEFNIAGMDTIAEESTRYWYKQYCIQPVYKGAFFPLGDHLLAQKLYIETNERGFLLTANDRNGVVRQSDFIEFTLET